MLTFLYALAKSPESNSPCGHGKTDFCVSIAFLCRSRWGLEGGCLNGATYRVISENNMNSGCSSSYLIYRYFFAPSLMDNAHSFGCYCRVRSDVLFEFVTHALDLSCFFLFLFYIFLHCNLESLMDNDASFRCGVVVYLGGRYA